MENEFIANLPDGFYKAISSKVKRMCMLKRQTKGIKSKPVDPIDLETIFLRFLLIGQQQKIELGPLFAYELCSVPPTLIDGQGCICKNSKSNLARRLVVIDISGDGEKMENEFIANLPDGFYKAISSKVKRMCMLKRQTKGIKSKPVDPIDLETIFLPFLLSNYPDANKVVVFDKYQDVSAKDHERMRRASEVVIDYELSVASHLPKRDAIMKSKSNK